jgi:uncharacterized protein YhbP (UPF0306 family)
MDIEKLIREYLPGVFHMSLATCLHNKPWVCEVHYVYDNDLNLYFLSKLSRRHSQEISKNPNVAGDIVKQHATNEKPRGIYFEGTAELMKNVDQNSLVYKLYDERFGISPSILNEIKHSESGHKFYKIIPESFVLFDAVNFPDNPRQEWVPEQK